MTNNELKSWIESHNPEHNWTWDDLEQVRKDFSEHIYDGTRFELFKLFELCQD